MSLQLQLNPLLNSRCFSRKLLRSTSPARHIFNNPILITSSTLRFSSLKLSRPINKNNTCFACKANGSDMVSQLELERPNDSGKPRKPVNGVFWIILLNLGVYVVDHLFKVQGVKSLYLYHMRPVWYQFVTATFCHANWNHLSSNLFFLYIFGKLVEEEEGNFGLWVCYILTGAGANLFSWLILPRNAVSVGASGAVFGLFTISVLVKVMEAAQASTALPGSFRAGYALQSINHIAHLSGALVGVVLVWLFSLIPSQPPEEKISALGKNGKRTL